MAFHSSDGRINVTEVDGTTFTGLHAPNGGYYIFDATYITTPVGRQHPCGALNVSLRSTPSEATTMYAPNGSINAYYVSRDVSAPGLNISGDILLDNAVLLNGEMVLLNSAVVVL